MSVVRRTRGKFLEDFAPGQTIRHKGGKTVIDGIFTPFSDFSMTTNPLSKNVRYAQEYGYDSLVCTPGLVMLIAFSQTVEDISENARANLGYIDMRFGAPLYVGDTVEVESTILGVRTSSKRKEVGIVHVQSTARKNGDAVVITFQRKVQVFKRDRESHVDDFEIPPEEVKCELWLPPYEPMRRDYKHIAHLTNSDTYFEDFEPGILFQHSRGRTIKDEHTHLTAMLDNSSQVHCNQALIDENPQAYAGGKLIVFGGIPFVLCLGLSCPDVADNALADLIYQSGRHIMPLFTGDTVFAETEIVGKRDHPDRDDLGILETQLFGYKVSAGSPGPPPPAPDGLSWSDDARIFELRREIVIKRRSHYT